jgi:hypothetical protein
MIQLTRATYIVAVFETWVLLWSVPSKLLLLTSVIRSILTATKVM